MSSFDIFKDPKVGDVVAWRHRHDRPYQRLIIARVTTLQIVTDCGRRFTRRRGQQVPASSHGYTCALPWTPEIDERIREDAEKAAFAVRMNDAVNLLDSLTLTVKLHASEVRDLPKFEAFNERLSALVEEFKAT